LPVPIRDNGDPGPSKSLLVLVHGFDSGPGTWDGLCKLFRADPEIQNAFDILRFDYKTGLFSIPLVGRLPTVREIGENLHNWLWGEFTRGGTEENHYIDVTLVGHSMGGLVIQSMLTRMLEAGHGSRFQYLRQAIFIATPHLGSQSVEGLRRLAGGFISNPQDAILRGLNDEVAALHERMQQRVLDARLRAGDKYPLPCTSFWGMEDEIVPEISAKGFFPVTRSLTGNHFHAHCPKSAIDKNYMDIRAALLVPHGHPAIHEIELFRYAATVMPLPDGARRQVRHGDVTREVESDNEAFVTREVTFSAHNNCQDPFELRYRTRNSGFIEPAVSPKMEMLPRDSGRYRESGTEVNYPADPQTAKRAALNMKVLRGFEHGHRNFHQHFLSRSYFRRVRFELDLTAYLSAGWHVNNEPKLYYHADDRDDHELCGMRDWRTPDPASGDRAPGKWRWELEHIRFGVLDLQWDVAQ